MFDAYYTCLESVQTDNTINEKVHHWHQNMVCPKKCLPNIGKFIIPRVFPFLTNLTNLTKKSHM